MNYPLETHEGRAILARQHGTRVSAEMAMNQEWGLGAMWNERHWRWRLCGHVPFKCCENRPACHNFSCDSNNHSFSYNAEDPSFLSGIPKIWVFHTRFQGSERFMRAPNMKIVLLFEDSKNRTCSYEPQDPSWFFASTKILVFKARFQTSERFVHTSSEILSVHMLH